MRSYLCGSACGLQIQYGSLSAQIGDGTEWTTLSVNLENDTETKNHNYIYVNHLFILTLLHK